MLAAPAAADIMHRGTTVCPADLGDLTGEAERTCTPPASMAADDFVRVLVWDRSGLDTITNTTTGGQSWTAGANVQSTTPSRTVRTFCATFNGTWDADPGFTSGVATANAFNIVISAYTPTEGSTISCTPHVAEADGEDGSVTGSSATGQTPTDDSSVTLAVWTAFNDINSSGLTAGWTRRGGVNQFRNLAGSDATTSIADKIQTSAAATGDVSNTFGTSSDIGWHIVTYSEAAALPEFSVDPTVTAQDDDEFTVGGTTDGAVTVYAVACAKDSTAPTGIQVAAADCTGDVDALASVNASWDGADSFVLDLGTVPLALKYDLYVWEGSNLITLADECLDAPAGHLSNCATGFGTIAMASQIAALNASIAPDLATGDVVIWEAVSTPGGYAVTITDDGYIDIDVMFDTSKQQFNAYFQDISVGGLHADDLDYFLNNGAPFAPAPDQAMWLVDAAITPIDLSLLFGDPDDDTLVFTQDATGSCGAFPTGISLTDGVISGTPTVEDEAGVLLCLVGTDDAGDSDTWEYTVTPIVTLPLTDCTSTPLTEDECRILIGVQFFGTVTVGSQFQCESATINGGVLSQDPAAGAELAPFGEVDLLAADHAICRSFREMRQRSGVLP
jgi:hypothetical protein